MEEPKKNNELTKKEHQEIGSGEESNEIEIVTREEDRMEANEEEDISCLGKIRRIFKKKEISENADGLSWDALKQEFTQDKIWNDRSKKDIFKNFAVVCCLGLLPTVFDLATDCLSIRDFIGGTVYVKHISNVEILNITNTRGCIQLDNVTNPFNPKATECTHTGSYVEYTDAGPVTQYEVIKCFEKDPIWGYVMLICIFFLPGCAGARDVWSGSGPNCTWAMVFISGPIFPFLVIGAKLVALVNPGEEWKKFTFRLTAAEGSFESKTSFLLQLFVIFTRADRQPSPVQLASMATSLVMMVKTQTQSFLKDQPAMAMGDHFKKAASVVPMILTKQISLTGSIAATAAILRYWTLLILILVLFLSNIIARVTSKIKLNEPLPDSTFKKIVTEEKKMKWFVSITISAILTWLLILTGLTITANVHPNALALLPNLPLRDIFPLLILLNAPLPRLGDKLSDSAIVQDIFLLNAIYTTVMISGAIYTILVYIQIVRPFNEHVEKQKTEKEDESEGSENIDVENPLMTTGTEASAQWEKEENQGEVVVDPLLEAAR